VKWYRAEYGIEALLLGLFMVSACFFTALLEYPASPFRHAIPDPFMRRIWIGLAMAGTAVALIYSPWGQRSGAHMNPSVTLAFWWLEKISNRDALFYIGFQFLGGLAGVLFISMLGYHWISHPSVNFIVTEPGSDGSLVAWIAEFAISAFLMTVILFSGRHSSLMRWTGLFAGGLVAAYIAFEAPLSGMSLNPARTLGSAIPAHDFHALWIYFTAPPLGMWVVAAMSKGLKLRLPTHASVCKADLHHH